MMHRACTLLAAAALCACQSNTVAPIDASLSLGAAFRTVPITRLRAEPYSYAFYSGMRASARTVVRDAATWKRVYVDIASDTPPAIDFGSEMAIVAALGERSSGGYGILIDSAATDGTTAVVWVTSSSPGKGCVTAQVLTQPVDIARMPRVNTVEFREQLISKTC